MRAVLAAAVLVLAACGEGDGSAASTTTDATQDTPPADSTTSVQEGPPAPVLGGTSWQATDYMLESGSITNVWSDTEITLTFGDNGTISGSTGCNTYSGDFEVEGDYDEFVEGVPDENDGQALVIGPLAVTERGCDDRIMEQESDFLDILANTGRWLIARGELHLRTAEGRFLLEAQPAA